jgi:hypothetical protein
MREFRGSLTLERAVRHIGGSMHRLAAAALAVTAVTACGGRSSKLVADDDGAARGGAGASATGGSSGMGRERHDCRTYAVRYTKDSNVETTCAFDRSALSLRCTSPGGETAITTWDSLDAVVDDNLPVGRITFATQLNTDAMCVFTNTMEYFDDERPLAQVATALPEVNCGNDGATYVAWDGFGRPLEAIANGVGAIRCTEQRQTFDYDDRAQRVVITTTGGSGDYCHDFVFTWTYDAGGLPLRMEYSVDGAPSRTRDYVTLETGSICRE